MKKIILGFMFFILTVIMTGCTKVEKGDYNEGTYFGFDDASKSMTVIYVDESGYIKSVFIDVAYMGKDATGKQIATTKQILGDAYGMKSTSPISAEWYEQANKVADKVVEEQGLDWFAYKYRVTGTDGKYTFTDEMPAGKTEADKKYTDSVSGVTITVDGIYKAILSALDKAK